MKKELRFSYWEPCLCGSGRLIKDCCLTAWSKTKPAGPMTGLSHPKCYARCLRDCSDEISREHFLSASVIKSWTDVGLAKVSGFAPINRGESTVMQIQNNRPKVLCKRHNNCLTGLDSVAKKFFTFLLERTPQQRFLLINGYELERWFLKVLCGYVAAGFVIDDTGIPVVGWTPPLRWLEILFGDEQAPRGCGLFFPVNLTWQTRSGRLVIEPHFHKGPPKEIALMNFLLDHFGFILTMKPLPPNAERVYRPSAMQIEKQGVKREAHFGWNSEVFVGYKIDTH
jgi:hypothetical protein